MQAAVVCLNEVDLRRQPEGLDQLAEASGTPHVHFFGHVAGRYGNALLSRFPIRQVRDIHLEGGTEVEWPPNSGLKRRIRRGLLAATLVLPVDRGPRAAPEPSASASPAAQPSGPGPQLQEPRDQEEVLLTVFCTHLDHMDEGQRMVQMTHALGEMRSDGIPHLLVGDLNALDANDYSATEWAALEQKAAESGWVSPSDATCVRLLLREGYVDAFRARTSVDGPLPVGSAKFTAHTTRPMYRIDYALLSPAALASGLRVRGAFVETAAEGSDHFPLVVDFDWEGAEDARLPGLSSKL